MALTTRKYTQTLTSSGILLAMLLSIVSFAKIPAVVQLHVAGLYGRVHEWAGIDIEAHKVALKMPNNAPIIISDYHSNVGANGYRRTGKHRGVDMFAEIGSPVIAAADGKVIKAKTDKCWGPTVLIRHGRDKGGDRVYALYGHVRNINVEVGQRVKRGQQIAEMGEDIFTKCGGGLHHLHFQLSYSSTKIPLGWGWANFVSDGARAPNPHQYWENGAGNITCFERGKHYSTSGLTYPLPCFNNKPKQQRDRKTILAQNNTSRNLPSPVVLNRPNAPLPAVVTTRLKVQPLIDLPSEYEELSLAEFFPKYSLSQKVKRQRPLPEKLTEQATLDGEFIASGVKHHSLTAMEAMSMFSSMSDWPE